MEMIERIKSEKELKRNSVFDSHAFRRVDESDDGIFYSIDRFVSHLDTQALSTVENLIGNLIIEAMIVKSSQLPK